MHADFKKFVFFLVVPMVSLLPADLGAQETSPLVLDITQAVDTISRDIYGGFSEHLGHCIYGGIWVGENSSIPNTHGIRNDVVEALKQINLPNLRWPGGCFADEYHWKDGVGPQNKRPSMINTNWGGVVEDNSFGTHEFLDFCSQIGTEPYITGNVGSGTVEEMSKWVEYLTFDGQSPMTSLRRQNGRENPWKIRLWGVGNESWGCGGNMTAEFYADQFRRYATYCRNYGNNRLCKIASGANSDDYHWTETLMQKIPANLMGGISLHYYTVPGTWERKGSATDFTEEEYFTTLKHTLFMKELVEKHAAIMDRYDPQKKVRLMVDEWGTWYDVEPGTNPGFLFQQNTMRDALVAGINLNIFNNHCDRVKGANIAQLVNVLQALILTNGDKMVLTPTYWVFYMYKVHQQAVQIPVSFNSPAYRLNGDSIPAVTVSASRARDGAVHLTFTQADPRHSVEIPVTIRGLTPTHVSGMVLTAERLNSHNTFEHHEAVKTTAFTGMKLEGNTLRVKLPPASVVMIQLY